MKNHEKHVLFFGGLLFRHVTAKFVVDDDDDDLPLSLRFGWSWIPAPRNDSLLAWRRTERMEHKWDGMEGELV